MEQIIHCPTEDYFIKAQAKFFKNGIYWIDGSKEINKSCWYDNKEETCIRCNGKSLVSANMPFYKQEYPNIPITKAKEFLGKETKWFRFEESFSYSIVKNGTTCLGDNVANKLTKKTFMQKLTNTLKRLLPTKIQAQYKAGYRNGDLELTDKGVKTLLEIIAEEFEDKLTLMAKEDIKEEERV